MDKTLTVGDVLDAIDKNGLKHIHGGWEELADNGTRIGGCALTQAAHNLGIPNPRNLDNALYGLRVTTPTDVFGIGGYSTIALGGLIIGLNDNLKVQPPDNLSEEEYDRFVNSDENYRTLAEITGYIRTHFPEILTKTFTYV